MQVHADMTVHKALAYARIWLGQICTATRQKQRIGVDDQVPRDDATT
jgi:hypothetical protein